MTHFPLHCASLVLCQNGEHVGPRMSARLRRRGAQYPWNAAYSLPSFLLPFTRRRPRPSWHRLKQIMNSNAFAPPRSPSVCTSCENLPTFNGNLNLLCRQSCSVLRFTHLCHPVNSRAFIARHTFPRHAHLLSSFLRPRASDSCAYTPPSALVALKIMAKA